MLLLTENKTEIELFGKKVWLSERTARDQQKMLKTVNNGVTAEDGLLLMAIAVHDGLKINLLPFNDLRFWQLKKKREKKNIEKLIDKMKLMELPVSVLSSLQDEILKLEGIDLDAIKKKVMETVQEKSREGLAVTLEPV